MTSPLGKGGQIFEQPLLDAKRRKLGLVDEIDGDQAFLGQLFVDQLGTLGNRIGGHVEETDEHE